MEDVDKFASLVGPNLVPPVDVVYLRIDMADPQIYQLRYDDVNGMSSLLGTLMPRFISITIPVDMANCSAVRMYLEDWDASGGVNFLFASFMAKMDIDQISPRCKAAIIVGVNDDMRDHDVFVNLPRWSYDQPVPYADIDLQGRVDILSDLPVAGCPLSTLREAMPEPEEWKPMLRCEVCSDKRYRCSGTIPCVSCVASGIACSPTSAEQSARIKHLLTQIATYTVKHNDLARYILHTQAVLQKGTMLVASDLKMIRDRLMRAGSFPLIPSDGPFPPELLATFKNQPYWKIEWMDSGKYVAKFSELYEKYIVSMEEVKGLSTKLRCAPKLVDTCGLAVASRAYEVWVASLDCPGKTAEYTCNGYWRGDGVFKTRIKTLSLRFGSTGVLSVTIVFRQIS